MSEELHKVKVPLWYRIKSNAFRPSQWWHFVYLIWYFRREHGASWFGAFDVSWSVWWMVPEDYGCRDDEHPTWQRVRQSPAGGAK